MQSPLLSWQFSMARLTRERMRPSRSRISPRETKIAFCQFRTYPYIRVHAPAPEMEKSVAAATPVAPFESSSMDELSEEETTLIIGLCVLIIVVFIILVGSVILCLSLRRGETFLWDTAEREARRCSKQSSLEAAEQ
ncbi:uncharacterized protein LOC132192568 [Neocloeon triangulifer]|uniref:uncharacterized protein LOC132192568 n=1 Tax=Neocloeon triangulifer TaxID=2078957 RepID=UPI00286F8559|nr:uncharacterized protein LOC132192568 [Neocloeon triangulifer]